MGLIRNAKINRNISIAENNGYEYDKVKKALEFLKTANRRTTKLQEYVDMHNYLKNDDAKIVGCQSCASAKYINSVEMYAKYGKLILENAGYSFDEPIQESQEPQESQEEQEEPKPKKKSKKK